MEDLSLTSASPAKQKYYILNSSQKVIDAGIDQILKKDPQYELIEAMRPTKMMSNLHQDSLDLILTDNTLPDANLLDVIINARSIDPDVQIIILTEELNSGEEDSLWRKGVDDVIVLPTTAEQIVYRVARALKMRRLCLTNIDLAERNQELWKVAATDGLTKLLNRRYFNQRCESEFARVARFGGTMGCVMVDIDHFRSINDQYGHPFGDNTLREISRILHHSVRSIDTVGRYGGEEFVMLMPETVGSSLFLVAERLRKRVEEYEFRTTDEGEKLFGPEKITISIGIASYPDKRVSTVQQLLDTAEQGLFKAKREGRNRVAIG